MTSADARIEQLVELSKDLEDENLLDKICAIFKESALDPKITKEEHEKLCNSCVFTLNLSFKGKGLEGYGAKLDKLFKYKLQAVKQTLRQSIQFDIDRQDDLHGMSVEVLWGSYCKQEPRLKEYNLDAEYVVEKYIIDECSWYLMGIILSNTVDNNEAENPPLLVNY